MVKYIPSRGDIVWLNFNPNQGNERCKTRPALVISPKNYNAKTNLAIFLPITSKVKGYPFEFKINLKSIQGAVLCDQVRSLDWEARNARKIDKLDEKSIEQILSKLYLLIGC